MKRTSPVGIFKQGNTPEGVSDLSGNMWEWTLSDYHSGKKLNDFTFNAELQKLWDKGETEEVFKKRDEKDRQLPVLRGGSWDDVAEYCRCAVRVLYYPLDWSDFIGFRCARTFSA